ncbi:MAG: putative DNA binding domain-containing protein [Erysipelotrichaceae bacterium]|nr:putative DNA binding domain-containing protein [Erysipelotrichaceae bacterium]
MNLGIESETIEFKLSTSQTSRALEALTAMLNKHGRGTVYFGVRDDGEVVGQNFGDKTIRDLSEAVMTRIKPQVVPTIDTDEFESKRIIIVNVEGNNKPYSADGQCLIRSGSENKKIDPELIKELVFTNSAEIMTNLESYNQELTFQQLKQLYILHGYSIDDRTFEKNTGLMCRNGKYNQLADLLSDNNDYSIKVVRFAGKDKSKMLVRNEYGYRCLLLAMQQALEYISSINETKVELSGKASRREIRLFDDECVREAWSNACLHTKWSKMIPPVINVYSDRIEIVSTGGLPVGYPLEDFYQGISHPVNRQLQKIMGQLGIVEQTGHGVPLIVSKYGRDAFEVTSSHITVTLKFSYETEAREADLSSLNESQKKVLNAIRTSPAILTSDIARVTGLSISSVNKGIRALKDQNKIRRIGSNKSGYWEII